MVDSRFRLSPFYMWFKLDVHHSTSGLNDHYFPVWMMFVSVSSFSFNLRSINSFRCIRWIKLNEQTSRVTINGNRNMERRLTWRDLCKIESLRLLFSLVVESTVKLLQFLVSTRHVGMFIRTLKKNQHVIQWRHLLLK